MFPVIVSKTKQDLNWSSQRKPRVLSGRIALHSYGECSIKMSRRELLQPFLINEGSHGRRQSENNHREIQTSVELFCSVQNKKVPLFFEPDWF